MAKNHQPSEIQEPSQVQLTGLLDLPWDIQADIFGRLDPQSRTALRQVCRTLRFVMDDPTFWKRQIVRLSSVRRFKEPMWNLLTGRKIRHIEVRPSADETKEYQRSNIVWNDLEWGQLADNMPDLKSIVTPIKCDKIGKGLPTGMLQFYQLENLRIHSVLRADPQLFRDVSCISTLKRLCLEITCVDVLVERTEALKHLANLQDLIDLEITFKRFTISNKQVFQYLLYHLPKLRRFALRRCGFLFPDVSVIFAPPPTDDVMFNTGQDPTQQQLPERVSRLNLEELDLSGTLQHGLNDEALSALDTLQIFRLQTHAMDDTLLDFFRAALTKWHHLRELDLRNAVLPSEVFGFLPGSTRIIHLNMNDIDFSIEALLKISEKCGQLQGLHLHGLEPKHLPKFYYLPDWFPNLQQLTFVGDLGTISREMLCRLSEMEGLRVFDVRLATVQPGKDVWEILGSLMGNKTLILT